MSTQNKFFCVYIFLNFESIVISGVADVKRHCTSVRHKNFSHALKKQPAIVSSDNTHRLKFNCYFVFINE